MLQKRSDCSSSHFEYSPIRSDSVAKLMILSSISEESGKRPIQVSCGDWGVQIDANCNGDSSSSSEVQVTGQNLEL